ncbi:MAG: hypothetical protein CL763_06180 [Chloroflexi bacterium]|nr:hypothetical protein [Chloroflexota bacterium]|tara:strand:- start:903 stop:1700 length:798 start_codon:yes stop_codon:yes gene_type:complete
MTGRDETERNYDIVLMIKKIALAIQNKDARDLRKIAEELQAWEPRQNWDDMDIRTKVFVEHVLLGFARITLGLEELDRGASELTELREEVERSSEDWWENDDDSEWQDKLDAYAEVRSRSNLDSFSRRNPSKVDEEEKFTCQKCGILKRKSAPGVSNCKEVDGYKICGRCYRAFTNWMEKKNKTLDDFWDKNVRRGTWDGGPIDPSTKEAIGRLLRDHSKPDGQVDWKRFHRAVRRLREDRRKDRRKKERYNKDELSDEEKEDLR